MPKISQLPSDATPASTDYVSGVQASVPGTVRFLLSSLATFFWTLANIPSGATSPITRDNESQFAFTASGLVWTGDSVGVNRNASMTAGICYINGRRISISAVTARTFTASKDTYIDILDNGDGTGTLVYTEATNNAASSALAANSLRIGIIVTGATTIATAGSVNQGQETMVLPIASSIPYAVTDSLGNLISPRDPSHGLLGARQAIANQGSITTTVDLTGLNSTIIVPTARKIKATVLGTGFQGSATGTATLTILEDGVVIASEVAFVGTATGNIPISFGTIHTPTAGSHTYKVQAAIGAGTGTLQASATGPTMLMLEIK